MHPGLRYGQNTSRSVQVGKSIFAPYFIRSSIILMFPLAAARMISLQRSLRGPFTLAASAAERRNSLL